MMKEAIALGEAEKKISKELPSFLLLGLKHPKPHNERVKEIETMLRPMFQRNIFLERYVNHLRKN